MLFSALSIIAQESAANASRAWRLFAIMTLLLALLGLGIVALIVLRRLRRRGQPRRGGRSRAPVDPWAESARRVSMQSEEGGDSGPEPPERSE